MMTPAAIPVHPAPEDMPDWYRTLDRWCHGEAVPELDLTRAVNQALVEHDGHQAYRAQLERDLLAR